MLIDKSVWFRRITADDPMEFLFLSNLDLQGSLRGLR